MKIERAPLAPIPQPNTFENNSPNRFDQPENGIPRVAKTPTAQQETPREYEERKRKETKLRSQLLEIQNATGPDSRSNKAIAEIQSLLGIPSQESPTTRPPSSADLELQKLILEREKEGSAEPPTTKKSSFWDKHPPVTESKTQKNPWAKYPKSETPQQTGPTAAQKQYFPDKYKK